MNPDDDLTIIILPYSASNPRVLEIMDIIQEMLDDDLHFVSELEREIIMGMARQ